MREELLNSDWIANILNISFTLFVLLLGVPSILIQTFLPEDLRKYYTKYNVRARSDKFISVALFLLLITIFLGNQAFAYWLVEYLLPEEFCVDDKEQGIVIYYLICLAGFIGFSWIVYQKFIASLSKSGIKKTILRSFFQELTAKIIKELEITPHTDAIILKSAIHDFSRIYATGIDRQLFLDEIGLLLRNIIGDSTTTSHSKYTGEQTKVIFQEILEPIFIEDFSNCTDTQKKQIIELSKAIGDKHDAVNHSTYDIEYIPDFLKQLGLKILDSGNLSILALLIGSLEASTSSKKQKTIFELCCYAFDKGNYGVVISQIVLLIQKLKPVNGQGFSDEKNNLIAYLAMFYTGNKVMKADAIGYLRRADFLKKPDAKQAKEQFRRTSNYRIVDKIDDLILGYF